MEYFTAGSDYSIRAAVPSLDVTSLVRETSTNTDYQFSGVREVPVCFMAKLAPFTPAPCEYFSGMVLCYYMLEAARYLCDSKKIIIFCLQFSFYFQGFYECRVISRGEITMT